MGHLLKRLYADRCGQLRLDHTLIGALVVLAVGVALAPAIRAAGATFQAVVSTLNAAAGATQGQ